MSTPLRIVTSGSRHIDIDALACMIAYTELLQMLRTHALAVTTASDITVSVSPMVRAWGLDYQTALPEGI